MSRQFHQTYSTAKAKLALEQLSNQATSPSAYADALFSLGKELGKPLNESLPASQPVTVACTVEDVDSLAKGLISILEKRRPVYLNVFWNIRFNAAEVSLAPIVREYQEHVSRPATTLIVIKSIIASGCVVKTNLTRLLETSDPENIIIAAPVILEGAEAQIEKEFDEKFVRRFQYLFFAKDDEKTEEGIVLPGIGGSIYQRLGYQDQKAKNSHIPELIKQRRSTAS